MVINQYISSAERFFIKRHLPHGIYSWRYLCFRPPRPVLLHRNIWLMGRPSYMPMALFLLLECFLLLRWLFFAAIKHSFRVVGKAGPFSKENIKTRLIFFRRFLSLALMHGIPPSDALAFKLYEHDKADKLWNYVYTHELPNYHRLKQVSHGRLTTMAMLQDKHSVTKRLESQGLPVVGDLCLIPKGARKLSEKCFPKSVPMFVKPRWGSGGRDCFIVSFDHGELNINSVKNGMIAKPCSVSSMINVLKHSDMIVQALIKNHPQLQTVCDSEDAVTVRVITQWNNQGKINVVFAAIEIPNTLEPLRFSHTILSVHTGSGVIEPPFANAMNDAVNERHDRVYDVIEGQPLPYWEKIKDTALKAHAMYPDVFSVAWDFVITATGPLILEGNAGWGTRPLQVAQGGLLADHCGMKES